MLIMAHLGWLMPCMAAACCGGFALHCLFLWRYLGEKFWLAPMMIFLLSSCGCLSLLLP
jgi:hypothetical protein